MILQPTDKLYFVFRPFLDSHTENDCIEIITINDISDSFIPILTARRNNGSDLHTICTNINEARALAATLLAILRTKLSHIPRKGLQQLVDDTIMGWVD